MLLTFYFHGFSFYAILYSKFALFRHIGSWKFPIIDFGKVPDKSIRASEPLVSVLSLFAYTSLICCSQFETVLNCKFSKVLK